MARQPSRARRGQRFGDRRYDEGGEQEIGRVIEETPEMLAGRGAPDEMAGVIEQRGDVEVDPRPRENRAEIDGADEESDQGFGRHGGPCGFMTILL